MVETHPAQPAAEAADDRQDVPERRRSPRYPAGSIGFRSGQIQACLIDLGSGGVAIESLEHPPIGGTLIFALERGSVRAEADAEVCWCNLKRTYRTAEGDIVPVYRAGLRLSDERSPTLDSLTRAARLEWESSSA